MRRFQLPGLNFLFRFQEVSHKYLLFEGGIVTKETDLQGRLASVGFAGPMSRLAPSYTSDVIGFDLF